MIFFIILITIVLTKCSSNDTFQKWRNVFVEEEDTVLLSYLRNYDKENKFSNNDVVKDDYYRTISRAAQNSCQIVKRFDGRWASECGFVDGEKLICMDGLYNAVQNGTCLVYSFGLADDWDFEISMASLGKHIYRKISS